MRRRKRKIVIKLSFDEVPEFSDVQRPDYLLLLDDGEVVIVEETGRPEFRDVKRVENATLLLRARRPNLLHGIVPSRITGVVHFRSRDKTFSRYLSGEQKKFWDKYRILLLGAACERELRQRLRIAFGESK